MAKSKNKSSGLKSKGERPNVNKKVRNAVRADRVQISDSIHSAEYKKAIILSPKSVTDGTRLREKFLAEEAVERAIAPLLNRFAIAGLTKAAAVQAVKTEKVPDLNSKWGVRLKNYRDSLNA